MTRQALLDAAQTRFFRDGYAATTVRAIAEDAGVDHALVNYYFGSKAGLFTDVLSMGVMPHEVAAASLAAGPDHFAERLLTQIVAAWEHPAFRDRMMGLLDEAMDHPELLRAFTEYLEHHVVGVIGAAIGGPHARVRAAGVSAVIVGTIFSRYILRVSPIATLTPEEVVRAVVPSLAVQLRGVRLRAPGG